jgi:hypothetical protein
MKRFLTILTLLTVAGSALAVIISGGDGTENTTAPSGDKGWSYVGRIDSASKPSGVTYISNNWFVTANHVWQNEVINSHLMNVVLNGFVYTVDTESSVQVTNSLGAGVDLRLFRVNSPVAGLAGVTVATQPPVFNTSITLIGSGMDRESALTYWYVNTSLWTWIETNSISGNFSGYKWATTKGTKRWGSNKVSSTGIDLGGTTCFSADFGSTSGEGMAATFDSGGGVFTGLNTSTKLVGIMITIGTYSNQPSAAVYGNITYMADLFVYQNQITNTVALVDADGDNLPDWWEYQYSGSIATLTGFGDNDGDDFSNYQEYIADTNPTNPASFFEMSGFLASTNQTVYFTGSTARQYQVFYSTNNLADPGLTWISNGISVWGQGTNTEDTVFYRLWVGLP